MENAKGLMSYYYYYYYYCYYVILAVQSAVMAGSKPWSYRA